MSEGRTPEELIAEAQVLEDCHDPNMWDAWLEGLSDAEMVTYQKWKNRAEFARDELREHLTLMADTFKQCAEVFKSLADLPPIPARALKRIEMQIPYEMAGCPYGKSNRGLAKWRKRQAC